jgi:hypothetical protein
LIAPTGVFCPDEERELRAMLLLIGHLFMEEDFMNWRFNGKWYENPACYYIHAAGCRLNLAFHLWKHGILDVTAIPRPKDFLTWGPLLLTARCSSSATRRAWPVATCASRDGMAPC